MGPLTQIQIEQFHKRGFLIIKDLLDKRAVIRLQNEIWEELEEEFGIKKEDKATWTTPTHSPRKAKYSAANGLLINKDFRSIIDTLIGKDNWKEPSSWGGFLITFPENKKTDWDLSDKLWHFDYELFRSPELGGLLIFSFFSDVRAQGGGTLVVSGSHNAIKKYQQSLSDEQRAWKHGQHRKYFMKTHPYFKKLTDPKLKNEDHIEWLMNESQIIDGISLQVVELTGEPGDVVFCHPRLVHAPAAINLNSQPRIMRSKFLW